MKTRLVMPDGTSRALTWTNKHPDQVSPAGVVLFRHSPDVLDADTARKLLARGARIETTHPARIMRALNFAPGDPGIVQLDAHCD